MHCTLPHIATALRLALGCGLSLGRIFRRGERGRCPHVMTRDLPLSSLLLVVKIYSVIIDEGKDPVPTHLSYFSGQKESLLSAYVSPSRTFFHTLTHKYRSFQNSIVLSVLGVYFPFYNNRMSQESLLTCFPICLREHE